VHGNPGAFTWMVYGKRKSINPEPHTGSVSLKGDGPDKWIEKKSK
jgi:hypothetical protein